MPLLVHTLAVRLLLCLCLCTPAFFAPRQPALEAAYARVAGADLRGAALGRLRAPLGLHAAPGRLELLEALPAHCRRLDREWDAAMARRWMPTLCAVSAACFLCLGWSEPAVHSAARLGSQAAVAACFLLASTLFARSGRHLALTLGLAGAGAGELALSSSGSAQRVWHMGGAAAPALLLFWMPAAVMLLLSVHVFTDMRLLIPRPHSRERAVLPLP